MNTAALIQKVWNFCAAFPGQIVPQDPNDEPASILLDRIRAQRSVAAPPPRKPRAAKASA